MNILLFIKQAFLSIISNKLRSFLSTLWIIIWISSFVIMLSLWEWAKQSMLKDFSWTSDVITIWKNYDSTNNWNNIINEKIALQIEENVPWVNWTLINYDFINSQANYLDITLYWSIKWVQQKFFKNKELELAYWSYFDEKNYKNSDKVIILWNKLIKSNIK